MDQGTRGLCLAVMKQDESTFLKIWTAKSGRKYHYSKFCNFNLVIIQVMTLTLLSRNLTWQCLVQCVAVNEDDTLQSHQNESLKFQ